MKTEIHKLLQLKHFFNILNLTDNHVKIKLKQPSQLLIQNIHTNWLKYNQIKLLKHNMTAYINLDESNHKLDHIPSVFGIMKEHLQDHNRNSALELNFSNLTPSKRSVLKFDLIVPQQDAVQYLIQWQRYRKYWWSSISTTPSLFSVNEFRYKDNTAQVDIVAQLPSGTQPVESLSFANDIYKIYCRLTCTMCLEDALFILLLDGLHYSSKDEYLRLHRKIAPYKISFALDVRESIDKMTLSKLATLLHHKLETKGISTWLPDFSLPLNLQIKENLRMGVTYTAILSEETLKYGIFKLMSNGTKLKEQIHVADFHKYASIIFEKAK